MYWAIGVEPTKPMAWTRGSSSSASTASLSPLTTLKTPVGQAGLGEELGEAQRHGGVPFGGLEDEGVAGGERRAGLPERDHGREVERRDAGDDAERLAQRVNVDAGSGVVREFALEQVRGAGGELDHLDAALDVTLGVEEGLAVFGGQQGGELIHVLVDQVHELEQDPAAALRVHGRPFELALFRVGDHVAHLLCAGQRQPGLDLARAGIVDIAEAPGGAVNMLPVNVVG